MTANDNKGKTLSEVLSYIRNMKEGCIQHAKKKPETQFEMQRFLKRLDNLEREFILKYSYNYRPS